MLTSEKNKAERGILMTTYKELLAKAEAGDSEAQYLLAMAIFKGKPEGDHLYPGYAVEWLEKAADQNHPGALTQLGYMYVTGDFVKVDEQKFFRYTLKAAQLGDSEAQNNIGWYFYTGGDFCRRDPETAFYWTKKAGDAGNVYAFETLAMMYWNGEGTETDFDGAVHWLMKGAEAGNPGMQKVLRQIKLAGINVVDGEIVLEKCLTSWDFNGETFHEELQCRWTAWPIYRNECDMTLQELIEEQYGKRLEISGGLGTSIEDAIVVDTKFDGVGVEYQVIRYLFDGQGKVISQSLMSEDGSNYDKLRIQVGEDSETIYEVYFNIDKFFHF